MFSSTFVQKALKFDTDLRPCDFQRIWTDTRTVQKGDLFAAVRGDRFDGHDFVLEASQKGALGALVSKDDFPGKGLLPPNFLLLQVPDVVQALRQIAKAHRERLKTRIFAVAGSNGKTTTKELIAFLLRQLHGEKQIFKTDRSNNSILGIALSLLQVRDEKLAVIEIGIDEPGWMEKHLEIVQPDAGLITMIGEEHLNALKTIEKVAEEELKLSDYLGSTERSFAANIDSPWIAGAKLPTHTLTYSLEKRAHIEGIYRSPQILEAFGLTWHHPLAGKHNAMNLLAALTAVRLLQPDLTLEQIRYLQAALPLFKGEKHRSIWLKVENDIQIYDDCYNANPESVEKGLQAFIELSDGSRQIAILGDMLDLGDATEAAHRRVLNLVQVLGIDQILLFGEHFSHALQNAKLTATDRKKIKSFTQIEDLKRELQGQVTSGDCLFLKGSRGMKLERVLELFGDQG